jgi:tetratricopeptide (TPR) repeat protein
MKDFLISYNKADSRWAVWIAWELEEAGFSTVFQAWDFRPGSNFVLEMDRAAKEAQRTIAVLSPDYLNAEFTKPEWAAAFKADPTGRDRRLIPVRVRDCQPEGLLEQIVYIDLVDLDEPQARETLLAGIHPRGKPESAPHFPGKALRSVPERPAFPGALPPVWNVPKRNPFFTGREEVLKQIRDALTKASTAALTQPQAISGLGGVGKTQTAVEYAYRHRNDYQAVLWVGADTREALVAGFVRIAELLGLPEKAAQDQNLAVAAVARWLENNSGWLLILDNADDPKLAREFLPKGQGHVLLTTRAQATGGVARRVKIEEMAPEEGALFLLRRTKILAEDAPLDAASETEHAEALVIAQELDGLPLALDQAGAYIEETGCGLSDYLALYRARGAELRRRRGEMATDHPDPVATTWDISFKKIEEANPAAAELLRFCAFLHPDAIPEELITAGAAELGPVLGPVASDSFELNAAIGETLKYSLLRRNPEAKTLDIHRLVQAVLKDGMDEPVHRQWAEHTMRAVDRAFPDVEFSTWPLCERLLPHAQFCAELIEKWGLEFTEATRLLNDCGVYLHHRARYAEAEPLYQRALAIREKTLGPEHPDVAQSLNNLAGLYYAQGQYAKAEPLHQRALAILEKALGLEHPYLATGLENYAVLLRAIGRQEEAATMEARAQAIRTKVASSQ